MFSWYQGGLSDKFLSRPQLYLIGSVSYNVSDIDECLMANPCQHGGTCNNLAGDFNCQCSIGWTGHDCQTGWYTKLFDYKDLSMNSKRTTKRA